MALLGDYISLEYDLVPKTLETCLPCKELKFSLVPTEGYWAFSLKNGNYENYVINLMQVHEDKIITYE